jgi:hypothetical protein
MRKALKIPVVLSKRPVTLSSPDSERLASPR